jgi:hypothetical protein
LLVKFKKPLHITDGEVVIPTKAVKGKTVELYYEYAKKSWCGIKKGNNERLCAERIDAACKGKTSLSKR